MENREFILGEYLAGGVERIERALLATLTVPRESAFI